VLGAVFRADGDAQHQRHGQDIGRHRLPLGHLVEDLVARPAHEIAVHQLGHDAPAGERIAHRRADDGPFRDRRIEQPVVREALGHPAIDAERAAPVAVLLAIGHHRRIFIEAVHDRLENGLGERQRLRAGQGHAVLQTEAGLPICHFQAAFFLGLQDLRLPVGHAIFEPVGEHHIADDIRRGVDTRGDLQRHGRLQDLHQLADNRLAELVDLRLAGVTVLDQIAPIARQRIVLAPHVDLGLLAIRGRV